MDILAKPTSAPVPIYARGKRVYLRPFSLADVPQLQAWINDPDLRLTLSRVFPADEEAERRFIQNQSENREIVALGICDKATDELLGSTGLHAIDWVSRKTEVGIFIGSPTRRGSGLGTDAMRTILSIAFETLNLNRVSLTVYETNTVAIRCYESLGFTREGIDREGVYRQGRYVDVIRMSMLAREWRARIPNRGDA